MFVLSVFVLPLAVEITFFRQRQSCFHRLRRSELGLTADELAFYDALTKPQAIKDFYENDELIAITKELAETLRKNHTIYWNRRK